MPARWNGAWSEFPPALSSSAPGPDEAAQQPLDARVGVRVDAVCRLRRSHHVRGSRTRRSPRAPPAPARSRSGAIRSAPAPRLPRTPASPARPAPGRPARPATSSRAAVPLPLSLIPGPAGTESRWPPAITTRSPRPAAVSAITLTVRRRSDTASTSSSTRGPSSRPAVAPTASTGISMPGRAQRRARRLVALAVHDQQCRRARGLRVRGPSRGRSTRRAPPRRSRPPRAPGSRCGRSPGRSGSRALPPGPTRSSSVCGTRSPSSRSSRRGGERSSKYGNVTGSSSTRQPASRSRVRHVLGRRLDPGVPAARLPPLSSAISCSALQVLAQTGRADLGRLHATVAGWPNGRARRRRAAGRSALGPRRPCPARPPARSSPAVARCRSPRSPSAQQDDGKELPHTAEDGKANPDFRRVSSRALMIGRPARSRRPAGR